MFSSLNGRNRIHRILDAAVLKFGCRFGRRCLVVVLAAVGVSASGKKLPETSVGKIALSTS
jgi:hypothetical protein